MVCYIIYNKEARSLTFRGGVQKSAKSIEVSKAFQENPKLHTVSHGPIPGKVTARPKNAQGC